MVSVDTRRVDEEEVAGLPVIREGTAEVDTEP